MISFDDARILRYLLAHDKCIFRHSDPAPAFFTEVRMDHLSSLGLVRCGPVKNDLCYILTPEGEDALSAYRYESRRRTAEKADRWWTRGLAIAAILISLAALILELDSRGYLDHFKPEKTHAELCSPVQSESQ